MQRRRFLLSSVALSGAALAGTAPVRAQNGPVFLDYTQADLDKAYDQAVWAPELRALQDYDSSSSAEVRKKMPPRTERYGTSDAEQIDIFTPSGASGVPVFVFIHGGAWMFNSFRDASYPAPTLVGRGGAYLTPGFDNIDKVRLPEMIEQCRSAVAWAVKNAPSYGGDPNRVYLGGHSSGGHLASCVLMTDWTQRGLPADAIKGAMLISGMYELYPVTLSSRGQYLKLTPEEVEAASLARHLHLVKFPVVVAGAELDSPEFQRQAAMLAQSLQGMGRLEKRIVMSAKNHFQGPQEMAQPDTELSRELFTLMKI